MSLSSYTPVYPIGMITIGTRPVTEYAIVPGGSSHEYEAAQMLAEYLERASGAFVPVRPEGAPMLTYEIVVGKTNRDIPAVVSRRSTLKNDGVLFYVAPNCKLYIDSETRLGVRYAVSKFLEKYIGVRFYDEQTERILPADAVTIPTDLDDSHSSPLLYRHTDWQIDRPLRHKWGLNGEDGIENTIVGFCHTMGRLTETSDSTQPCLTDENVFQTALKNVKKWIVDNPGCRIISVTQNDNGNYCKCPRCQALAEKENQSGVMITFVNRLAEAIEKDYPAVNLLTFAYQYTRKPPQTIKPRRNVIIWMCSIECCFSHPLKDDACELNKAFHDDLTIWSNIAEKVYIWDYTTNYAHYCLPFPNFKTLLPNIRFYCDNHCVAVYEEGGHQQKENGEFRALRAYMMAQMLWNPYMAEDTWDHLIKDFLEGYYGAGWPYIYQYINKTCERATGRHLTIYMYTRELFSDGTTRYTDPAFDKEMLALWDKAEAGAVTAKEKYHCASSRIQMDLQNLAAIREQTGILDPKDVQACVGQLKKAGVNLYREGGNKQVFVRWLNPDLVQNCPPEEWNVLYQNEWRAKFGLTPMTDAAFDNTIDDAL